MSSQIISRFTKSFIIDGAEVTVEFHPVNIARKQLYQVYIPLKGNAKPVRIHMQINAEGRFKITAKEQAPAVLHEFEAVFEQAIIES